MPYFRNDDINVLFIHIPKTGGTSLEEYFIKKYNMKLNNNSLYGPMNIKRQEKYNINLQSSLQHIIYSDVIKYNYFFEIDMNNIMIISIVRNPYNRIMSDLFFFNKINIRSTKSEIFSAIQKYLTEHNDNHVSPQYMFITDENKKIFDNIKILHTETLTTDMHNLGFTDFNVKTNCNKIKIDYYSLLNNDSIELINNYYDDDFKIFNYEKIKI